MRSDLDLEIGLPQRILTTFLYFLLPIRAPRKKKNAKDFGSDFNFIFNFNFKTSSLRWPSSKRRKTEEEEEGKKEGKKGEKKYSKYNEIEEIISPISKEAAGTASCCRAAGAMRAPSPQPDGGYRGSQPGCPAPPSLGCSPPPGFHLLPPHARMADPSPSAESRWGHHPARDPTGTLPRGSENRKPAPATGALSGERWVPRHRWTHRRLRGTGPPRRQRARGSAGPGPPTGASKSSGTHKLRRELFPKKGFF